jgi:hypothetical protein
MFDPEGGGDERLQFNQLKRFVRSRRYFVMDSDAREPARTESDPA